MTDQQAPVTAHRVAENRRLRILPKYAGDHMMALESLIFNQMRHCSEEYNGGYWIMWELSNGAFYMAPDDEQYQFDVIENYFSETLTGDAAGIVVCLFAFNRMAWATRSERFSNLFHNLREWAKTHPESDKIMRAID